MTPLFNQLYSTSIQIAATIMGRHESGSSKKKQKIKLATHIPSLALGSSSKHIPAPTVKVKKLKATGMGFKVTDSSFHSDVNAAIAAFTWKETQLTDSQMDAVWDRVHRSSGWDQGYVDSFVNQDKLPPEADPELPKTTSGKGVGVLQPIPISAF
ncbi:hypothetical protein EST38_g11192 [Candolleomyces aberdarensis]|uniref:Uncharacterized protein n=1 Tax=Candolleomyces aberdarensis TaxID=2316362 RepID=A0A4Q2D7S2_9AGAR|nr:hypothetical protein EST38_g11192 [Candolleomyces aberdarensis]